MLRELNVSLVVCFDKCRDRFALQDNSVCNVTTTQSWCMFGPYRKEGAQVGLWRVAVERLRSQRRGLWARHQGRNTHRNRLQADHQDPTLQDPLQLEEEVWR